VIIVSFSLQDASYSMLLQLSLEALTPPSSRVFDLSLVLMMQKELDGHGQGKLGQ
jgi:hypothetical protein